MRSRHVCPEEIGPPHNVEHFASLAGKAELVGRPEARQNDRSIETRPARAPPEGKRLDPQGDAPVEFRGGMDGGEFRKNGSALISAGSLRSLASPTFNDLSRAARHASPGRGGRNPVVAGTSAMPGIPRAHPSERRSDSR